MEGLDSCSQRGETGVNTGLDRSAGVDSTKHRSGVALFYVGAVFALLFEAGAVQLIRHLAASAGASSFGPILAWFAFCVGGAAWGVAELRLVSADEPLFNPILRACCWVQNRLGVVGYVVNAAALGGAPGTAVALKRADVAHPRALTVLAAAVFATVWVPLYILVWP